MALLNIQFGQEELQQATADDFAPIPAGIYTAEITRSEVKDTRAGTGNYLSLGFKILEGQYAGRIVFHNINLKNPNDIAVQIGRKELAKLLQAIGRTGVQESSELHGIPMQIKVAIEIDKTGRYEPSNSVKNFAQLKGSRPQAQPQQAAPVQQAQDDLPPWQRG